MRTLLTLFLILILATPLAAATITGKVATGLQENGDVVVYIEKIPGKTFVPPAEPVKLDQIKLMFVPHVLPILVGTRVAFPNSDEIRHNVVSKLPPDKFNLGTYPSGKTMFHIFNEPGEITLLCNVHLEMSAYVLVLETPYFAKTDVQGNYTIPNVPPGTYKLTAWHERLKRQSSSVLVPDSGSVVVNFQLKK